MKSNKIDPPPINSFDSNMLTFIVSQYSSYRVPYIDTTLLSYPVLAAAPWLGGA